MRRFIWPLVIIGGLAIMGRTMRRWFGICTVLLLAFLYSIERREIDPITGGGRYAMTPLSWLFLAAFIVAVVSWAPLVHADRRRRSQAAEEQRYVGAQPWPAPEVPMDPRTSVQDLGEVPESERVEDPVDDLGWQRSAPIWVPTPAINPRRRPQHVEETETGMIIRDRRSVDPDEL